MLYWNEILLFCNLCYFFGLNPCKNSNFAQFFGNFDFVFAVWELILGAKTQIVFVPKLLIWGTNGKPNSEQFSGQKLVCSNC